MPTADGATFTKGIEENLKTLGTEYVDLAYIHSVGKQNVDMLLSTGGSLEACDELDAVMFAMNFIPGTGFLTPFNRGSGKA